jgi:competence protein ComEA
MNEQSSSEKPRNNPFASYTGRDSVYFSEGDSASRLAAELPIAATESQVASNSHKKNSVISSKDTNADQEAPLIGHEVADPKPRPNRVLVLIASVTILVILFTVYLPYMTSRPSSQQKNANPAYQIDFSRADKAELMQIPGIGPNRADAIIAGREAGEGKADSKIKGLGPKTLENIKPFVKNDDDENAVIPTYPERPAKFKPGDKPIDINKCSETDLLKLPSIGPTLASRIMAARPFQSVDDLAKVKGVGAKIMAAIRPFVTIESQ